MVNGVERLRRFLDEHDVRYEMRLHAVAFTAQELAAVEHVSGAAVGKVVIAFVEDEMVMLVLPADRAVDLMGLAVLAGGRRCRLAHEEEFTPRFGDCDAGAMSPFGNLYGVRVYLDRALAEQTRMVFQAGSHTQTIELATSDFVRIVEPTVGSLSVPVELARE